MLLSRFAQKKRKRNQTKSNYVTILMEGFSHYRIDVLI